MSENLLLELVFDHSSHMELWDWLAKNPQYEKEDWPGWYIGLYGHVEKNCFACEFVMQSGLDCSEDGACCPLEWPYGHCIASEYSGLFNKWMDLGYRNEPEARACLALQIRDLPVRSGVKCK